MPSSDLRDKVLRYVEGRMSLAELEAWLAPRVPAYVTHNDTPDSELSAAVELGVAEINDGIATEHEFRAALRWMVESMRHRSRSTA